MLFGVCRGLAAQSEVLVNWCPALGTVLANEEVIGGTHDIHTQTTEGAHAWHTTDSTYLNKIGPLRGHVEHGSRMQTSAAACY